MWGPMHVLVTCQEIPPTQPSNQSPKAQHTFSLVSFWDSCVRSTLCQATPKKQQGIKKALTPPEALIVGLC